MKKRGMVLFLLLGIVLIFSFISASFTLGELTHSIDYKYGPENTLRGWINISLTEEPSKSVFESSEGDTATLITLINGDSDFVHTCEPLTCISNYDPSTPEATKIITLDAGEFVILGFKLSGSISEVSDFSMDISSNAPESIVSQLDINLLNNNDTEWQPHTASGEFGAADYGCYVNNEEEVWIVNTEYCEKITVPASPNVEIGANVIGTEKDVSFDMTIESLNGDGDEYGSCVASASGTGEINCVPLDYKDLDFMVKEQRDYIVCIKTTDSADDRKYEINSEEIEPLCGFSGIFDEYDIDFDIFAKPGKYAPVGDFVLDSAELDSIGGDVTDIETYIEDYLSLNYDNQCPDDCIIPIKITSRVNQDITISNPSLSYTSNAVRIANELYDLEETPAKINADMQKLKIDSGEFGVPSDYGDHTISLSFNEEEIFSEEISIEKVPIIKSLNTATTAANYSTIFVVKIESEKNISSYEWDFGNGDMEDTETNTITYAYESLGTYNLKVKVNDVDGGTSSKNFVINVGSASEVTGTLLQEKKLGLGIIQDQLNNFSVFEVEIINQTLNLEEIETKLDKAETDNIAATTEDDYQAVLQILQSIEVPQMIFQSSIANSIIFYPQKSKVNVDILADITGENYDSSKESKYINSILGWNVENVDITVTYKEITSVLNDYSEPLLKFFEVDITKKAGSEGDGYIILKDVDGLTFEREYFEEEMLGYVYFPLIEESKKIVFSTTEDIDFIDLPLFVAPEISELSLVDFEWSPLEEDGKLKRWVLYILIIILLFIIGAIFWIILQTWYKRKYENYLFKNKNNLYNLFNWIETAKKRGLTEKEIVSKLKNVGWTSEQVRYATRKHAGKRTGMPEIPIKKLEKKSVPQGRIPDSQSRTGPK